MDTKELSREQISAFADGELSEAQTEVVLAALRTEQGLAAWNAYHLVGDAARSDETAVAMSPDFFSKFSARLDAEPTVIAPAQADRQEERRSAKSTARRFAVPALALSLIAAVVIMMQPQQAAVVATATPAATSSAVPEQLANGAIVNAPGTATVPATAIAASPAVATLVTDGEVVRDPKIDKFLGKHETFTPQQSSEQFSRSAAFKVEADK
jgi:sigma-E factor negative regulatory protein RseA